MKRRTLSTLIAVALISMPLSNASATSPDLKYARTASVYVNSILVSYQSWYALGEKAPPRESSAAYKRWTNSVQTQTARIAKSLKLLSALKPTKSFVRSNPSLLNSLTELQVVVNKVQANPESWDMTSPLFDLPALTSFEADFLAWNKEFDTAVSAIKG